MTQKSRKIRAIAAGGAVLGVGAAVTLAAWSDSEFANGLFSSGTFGIEAATDGENFTENADETTPLTIEFAADTMYPGQTVAAPYQIRNIEGGADSVVTFAGENITDALAEHLTVEVLQTTGIECTPETTGDTLALNGTFGLEGVTPQNLCVQVTLDGEYGSSTSEAGAIAWQFNADQVDGQPAEEPAEEPAA